MRSTVTPSDCRFNVSEVARVDEAGRAVPVSLAQDGIWQLDNVALLDFQNGTDPCRNGTTGMNTEVRGKVPVSRYGGLRFTLGVPLRTGAMRVGRVLPTGRGAGRASAGARHRDMDRILRTARRAEGKGAQAVGRHISPCARHRSKRRRQPPSRIPPLLRTRNAPPRAPR